MLESDTRKKRIATAKNKLQEIYKADKEIKIPKPKQVGRERNSR